MLSRRLAPRVAVRGTRSNIGYADDALKRGTYSELASSGSVLVAAGGLGAIIVSGALKFGMSPPSRSHDADFAKEYEHK